jgi:predicted 3-demethylubiquinone-9 3-methyltransferase (glyoxalase superfamily)
MAVQKITPFLWFNDQAEEAAEYYIKLFSARKSGKKSKILAVARYEEEAAQATGRPKDSVMVVNFKLEGQDFVALNGGPQFPFTEAVSFVIDCKDQREVDYFWKKLGDGGKPSMCGWIKDKFGLSWQVVPTILNEMMLDKNKEKARRATNAMLQMRKIDIKALKKAFNSK